MEKESIALIIVDEEEEFEVDLDKKQVKGLKKVYSKEEFKEKSKKFPFVVIPPKEVKRKAIYSFTNKNKFEKWLEKEKLLGKYNKIEKLIKKSTKERTKEQIEEIRKYQEKTITEATELLQKELEKNKIESNDVEKIEELKKDIDPLRGPAAQCIIVYEHPWFQGGYRHLIPGIPMPDFTWFGFNDVTSAIFNIGHFVRFYEHTWFTGRQLLVFSPIPDLVWAWWLFFNDIISLAIVF